MKKELMLKLAGSSCKLTTASCTGKAVGDANGVNGNVPVLPVSANAKSGFDMRAEMARADDVTATNDDPTVEIVCWVTCRLPVKRAPHIITSLLMVNSIVSQWHHPPWMYTRASWP